MIRYLMAATELEQTMLHWSMMLGAVLVLLYLEAIGRFAINASKRGWRPLDPDLPSRMKTLSGDAAHLIALGVSRILFTLAAAAFLLTSREVLEGPNALVLFSTAQPYWMALAAMHSVTEIALLLAFIFTLVTFDYIRRLRREMSPGVETTGRVE